jgi:hypothetical protein
VTAPLLLCGSLHDPGVGRIKVGMLIGDEPAVDLRTRVLLEFAGSDRLLPARSQVRRVR